MCYGQERPFSRDPPRRLPSATNGDEVDILRLRLAETEARIARARAREAELTRRLAEMKRFVSVMEILDGYLKRRFRERQQQQRGDSISTTSLS